MPDLDLLWPIVVQGLGVVGLTLLIFYLFKWHDLRKSEEKRDSWGPWGILLPLSVMGMGSVLFAAVANLLLRLELGFSYPLDYFIISFYGGLAFVYALFIRWSFDGHRRRLNDVRPVG